MTDSADTRRWIRVKVRDLLERIGFATRVLPWLGFGSPKTPPTESIAEREASISDVPEPPALHEQQHVPPTQHQDPRGEHPR